MLLSKYDVLTLTLRKFVSRFRRTVTENELRMRKPLNRNLESTTTCCTCSKPKIMCVDAMVSELSHRVTEFLLNFSDISRLLYSPMPRPTSVYNLVHSSLMKYATELCTNLLLEHMLRLIRRISFFLFLRRFVCDIRPSHSACSNTVDDDDDFRKMWNTLARINIILLASYILCWRKGIAKQMKSGDETWRDETIALRAHDFFSLVFVRCSCSSCFVASCHIFAPFSRSMSPWLSFVITCTHTHCSICDHRFRFVPPFIIVHIGKSTEQRQGRGTTATQSIFVLQLEQELDNPFESLMLLLAMLMLCV